MSYFQSEIEQETLQLWLHEDCPKEGHGILLKKAIKMMDINALFSEMCCFQYWTCLTEFQDFLLLLWNTEIASNFLARVLQSGGQMMVRGRP